MVNAVLVTHGLLGAELVKTAEEILGPQTGIGVVSNSGVSLDRLSEHVGQLLSEDNQPVVLLVDLIGGSCSHAAQEIQRLHPNAAIVSGVNLPILLEFIAHRDRLSFDDLIIRLCQKGKDGIRCL